MTETENVTAKEFEILESFHTGVSYELDSFGHVNNAVFLNYLEKARCDFMLLKGLQFDDFFKWHRYPVVIRANLEFKRPAHTGDRLAIKARVTSSTQTSFTLRYEIINLGTNALILTGETSHVFIDDNNRPTRIPGEFYDKFIGHPEHTKPK